MIQKSLPRPPYDCSWSGFEVCDFLLLGEFQSIASIFMFLDLLSLLVNWCRLSNHDKGKHSGVSGDHKKISAGSISTNNEGFGFEDRFSSLLRISKTIKIILQGSKRVVVCTSFFPLSFFERNDWMLWP